MFIKTRYRCYAIDHQVATPGYIDKEHRRVQYFEKVYTIFGIPVYFKLLFKEQVPNWAWIQQGTHGWCEWRSECPPDIWLLCTGKPKG